MKNVHLIFKTHLDLGFTDFAATVFRKYREQYIPQALALARALRESGGPERFIWTTGSWLVYEYLEQATPSERKRLEKAIAAGDIAWHALPYTTHTELMDPSLFRFGLSLAQELDRHFGRTTIAAKMTDVPGHCRAMVPLLAEAGVQFLHIGVNPACSPPDVPPLFRWRAPDGSEIIVAYSSDYGSPFEGKAKEMTDALAFAHTGDNCGPPSIEAIRKDFQHWRELFPGAVVAASTLDAYAKNIARHRDRLPIITAEIGDTWIYGTGSDPLKVTQYRALCRLRNKWEKNGRSKTYAKAFRACSHFLLNVAEHTWGMDEKTHLGDYVNYGAKDFVRARQRDLVPASAVPPEYKYFGWAKSNSRNLDGSPRAQRYSLFASSWDEQHAYVRSAVKALAGTTLAADARRELRQLRAVRPSLKGFTPLSAREPMVAGRFQVKFDRKTGALIHLQTKDGRSLCAPNNPLGLFRYQTFSQRHFDRYVRDYGVHIDRHAGWCLPDMTKPGMDQARPRPRDAFFAPVSAMLYLRQEKQADVIVAALTMPVAICREAGAPRTVFLRYAFSHAEPRFDLELSWFDKTATRLPEAAWLSFQPLVSAPKNWQIEKMGEWFSPLEVCSKGNRNLHATGAEIRHTGRHGTLTIESLDAHLVAPGAPRLLEFDNSLPPLAGGMHFNLHNNLYGTNFPMWYDDDARFRFTVRIT
jgi:hypothetical protein